MSQKRKAAEQPDGDSSARAPLRKKPFKPHQKSRTLRQDQSSGGARTQSTGELRNRIRNLKRLLEHVDSDPKNKMPAHIRVERERELATAQHELEEKTAATQAAERRRNMISKYHHIRFFDRQKANRILKKLRRELAALKESSEDCPDSSKIKVLEKKAHDAEVAVNYAIYYPLMKPYFSMYPRTRKDAKADDIEDQQKDGKTDVVKGDPEMWAAVERAMKEGTLDQLRNTENFGALKRQKEHDISQGKSKEKKKEKRKEKAKASASKQRAQTTEAAGTQDDGEDSDGGFFE